MTTMQDMDDEILVTHFCVQSEYEKLLEWCSSNAPRDATIEARVKKAISLKDKGNDAARQEKWQTAVWIYLAALHHLDFSIKDAAAMTVNSEDEAKASVLKESVNAATLLVLMNLSFAFLQRGDGYNADRCATLGLWYESRSPDVLARAKLLFRRGSARVSVLKVAEDAVASKKPGSDAFAKALTDPERFAPALADAAESVALQQKNAASQGPDKATTALLREVTRLAKNAGGSIVPSPIDVGGAKKTEDEAAAAAKAAGEAAAASMEDMMQDTKWMGGKWSAGKEEGRELLKSDGTLKGSGQSWDVVGQLKVRFVKAYNAANFRTAIFKTFMVLALQASVVIFELPGHKTVSWFSSGLAVAVVMARPLFAESDEGKDQVGSLITTESLAMAERTSGKSYGKLSKKKKKKSEKEE